MPETSQLIERYDLAQWQRDLEAIFGRPHTLIVQGRSRFYGATSTERFGNLSVIQLFTETPIEVRSGVLRASPNPFYHIFFIDHGEMQDAGGKTILARSMMLVNSHHAYHARQSAQFRSLVVTIPASLARSRLPDIDQRCGPIISSAHGPQRVLHDYVVSLLSEAHDLPVALREQTEAHMLDLLCAAAPGAGPLPTERQCPRQYIAVHLADPALSPRMAAQALGLSVRTIHARMEQLGTSFVREVREQRLQRCHEDLSKGKVGGTITEVAARWGFLSPSSFSRLFRIRFGMSPRECKKAATPAH